MPIRILDSATVGRIAAGEVVERPMSVVKELMENSIDAGATSITVDIKGGGIDYLRVTDNGCGIEPGQVCLAFENHATSKIQTADQLDDIRTLGFRGEALPSIASVAHVEMTTRTKANDTGVRLNIDGGQDMRVKEIGCPEGTTIVIRDLFYNLPVRRAFLKKPGYEGGLVSDTVARMILGNPGVAVRLLSNGSSVYHSFGDGSLRHAVFAVYGKDTAEQMVELDASEGGTRIYGLIGVGELAKSSRAHQAFFINGRAVRCALLSKALEEVCRSRVTIGMYPMCALNIVIPATSVNVNVHPNKLEVRFKDEMTMRLVAERLLAKAFEGERVLQIGPDAPVKPTVERVSKITEVVPVPPPVQIEMSSLRPVEPAPAVIPPAADPADPGPTPPPAPAPSQVNPVVPPVSQSATVREKAPLPAAKPAAQPDEAPDPSEAKAREEMERLEAYKAMVNRELEKLGAGSADALHERRYPGWGEDYTPADVALGLVPPEQKTYADSYKRPAGSVREEGEGAGEKPLYRVIGVFLNTYILIEADNSLVIIDQHAAHERLQYEKFMKQLEAGMGSQQLLTPLILHLSAREMALVNENLDVLTESGYSVEAFGETDIQVRAVPYILGKAELKPAFMDTINALYRLRNATVDLRRAEVAQMSCKSAIKGGDPLSRDEIDVLIRQLLETGAPPTCPHGRPVMKSISQREMEKMFKRIQ